MGTQPRRRSYKTIFAQLSYHSGSECFLQLYKSPIH